MYTEIGGVITGQSGKWKAFVATLMCMMIWVDVREWKKGIYRNEICRIECRKIRLKYDVELEKNDRNQQMLWDVNSKVWNDTIYSHFSEFLYKFNIFPYKNIQYL